MDADIVERLDAYCEELGQSKTLAVERILKDRFDKYDKDKKKENK